LNSLGPGHDGVVETGRLFLRNRRSASGLGVHSNPACRKNPEKKKEVSRPGFRPWHRAVREHGKASLNLPQMGDLKCDTGWSLI